MFCNNERMMPILAWRRPRNPFNIPAPILRRSLLLLLFSLVSSSSCRISNNEIHLSFGAPLPVVDKQNVITVLLPLTEELLLLSSSWLDDTEESELTGAELDKMMSPLNRTKNMAFWKVNNNNYPIINQSGMNNGPVMVHFFWWHSWPEFNLWHKVWIRDGCQKN